MIIKGLRFGATPFQFSVIRFQFSEWIQNNIKSKETDGFFVLTVSA